MWSTHPAVRDIMAVKLPIAPPHTLETLCKLLKQLQPLLRHLHRDHFSDLREQQQSARLFNRSYNNIQGTLSCFRRKSKPKNDISLLIPPVRLLSNNNVEWLKYGDDYTKLFFAKTKQRKLASYIYSLQNSQGQYKEGFERVGHIMFQFYKILLGSQPGSRNQLDHSIITLGPVLTKEQQIQLCKDFSDRDIREAFFSIPNTKSPDPDGYTSGFFKTIWPQFGLAICSAVRDFFHSGQLPKSISLTKLVVLLKVQHPQSASDFRPISCCNILYKCLTKLLSHRIKEILPYLIHQSQGAFVKGLEILYNILICQDLARGYQRQHISPRCMLKIDLQKAFDSVHWGFLQDLLVGLKFPPIFVSWIMKCVSSVTFSVHINGQDCGSFEGGRGLRQGDPLSPLLFVLTMEYFSRSMQQISQAKNFKYHPHCKGLGLIHLIFADDLILFCKADPTTL
ncbi:LOW QUALITY PROTEIN: hypothetical protein Cgig2_034025 [Carnegiea gigantea]|uniref:Reverse transcriptase domain-containing protein n=1 Tax=Carnegiea gigantea TaxID=171969 RepID=A0A9Q1JJ85_9CARY|nr:LOW QUALITY PROTEIN: hypothetical protein Cgig2_034025 [Carnegiea gigantea]